MINDVMFRIKQNDSLYMYLKYHSNWYLNLSRNINTISDMVIEMKREYKLTNEDRIEDFTKKLEMISSILQVLS